MAKILIVDDEPQVLQALRRVLRRAGFEIELAGSGEEALAKLATFSPDIVLSDFRMPGMNGAQLLAAVKQRHPLALRIIISGYADLGSVSASVNEGEICRFISKPWDDDTLAPVFTALLDERDVRLALDEALRPHAAAAAVNGADGRAVEIRLVKADPFSESRALEVLQRFVGALEAERIAIVSGLLQRHGGRLTLTAELGGEERLFLEIPVAHRAARPAPLC